MREKELKEKAEHLEGFIIRAGHDAKIFKNQLNCMEDSVCQCGMNSFGSWGGVCFFGGGG